LMRWRQTLPPVAFALLVAVAVACSTNAILSQVGEFPCAADGTCPSGYFCEGPAGCQSGAQGKPLAIDLLCGNDEATVISSARCQSDQCVYGVCAAAPESLYLCPGDHPVYALGGCLRECSDSDAGACPAPLACGWVFTGENAQQLSQVCVSPTLLAVEGTLCSQSGYQCEDDAGNGIQWIGCENSVCVIDCSSSDAGPQCPPGQSCVGASCFPLCGSGCTAPLTCDPEAGVCMGPP